MQSVRVIAGLGNPGAAYDGTRHNIGFALVDQLAAAHKVSWKADSRFCAHTASIVLAAQPVLLIKPQTFMNLSGRAIGAVCRYFKWSPREVLVAYDEVQLPLGRLKISLNGGAGGHNGVASIISLLGADFPRLRLGIGAEQRPEATLTDFVLGHFSVAEQTVLENCWQVWVEAVEKVVRHGPLLAANSINQRPTKQKPAHDASV